MIDPLSEYVDMLAPRAVFSKGISGAGRWAVRYSEFGEPGFCAVLEGRCRLHVDGLEPATLEQGDFVLLPATPAFTMSSFDRIAPVRIDPKTQPAPTEEVRHGRRDGPPDVRLLGGYFKLGSPDAGLLLSLLPTMVHVRGNDRLSALVRLVGEEAGAAHMGRQLMLARLVEMMMIEALRAGPQTLASPGLVRGLADARLAAVLRTIHGDVERPWTIAELAAQAGMSRSAFFDRFTRLVGLRPMQYLLSWRMAVARKLLRDGRLALDEIAMRVGYGSASTFSTAFSRHFGLPPGRFARSGRS